MGQIARIAFLAAGAAACTQGGGGIEQIVATVDVFDGSARLDEDGSAAVLLVAEVSTGESPTFEITSQPTLGRLVGSGFVYEYVPDENQNGTDTFRYRAFVSDEETSDVATWTVFIDPVNDAPRGTSSQLVTDEDTPGSGPLPASDIEGDALTFSLVEAAENGRVDIDATGTFTYTPNRDYVGDDSFLWTATDSSNASTGPVRVDIDVAPVNDVPVVQDNGFVGPEDEVLRGTLFGTDADGDSLTWTVVTQPDHGALLLNTALGTFDYTPDVHYFGPDAFEVVASDGLATSEPGAVDITITSVNDVPRVTPATFTTDEDVPVVVSAVASDADGDPITFRIDSPPAKGIAAIDGNTGELTYTPNPDTNGNDSFTVIAADLVSESPPGLVRVAVIPVNDPPRLSSVGLLTTDEDTIVTGLVSGSTPRAIRSSTTSRPLRATASSRSPRPRAPSPTGPTRTTTAPTSSRSWRSTAPIRRPPRSSTC